MKRQHRFAIGFLALACLQTTAYAQQVSVTSPVRLVSGTTETGPANAVAVEAPTANHELPSDQSAYNDFPSLLRSSDATETADGEEQGSVVSDQLVGPAITVGSSLVVVLGLFAGLVWITRKFGGRGMNNRSLPSDVVQSLGSTAIDARTRLTLVRCGQRILVLSQTASGIQSLAEITDRDEVTALTATCLGNSKAEFASALRSIEREKSPTGYLGPQADTPPAQPRRQLFTTA